MSYFVAAAERDCIQSIASAAKRSGQLRPNQLPDDNSAEKKARSMSDDLAVSEELLQTFKKFRTSDSPFSALVMKCAFGLSSDEPVI